MNPTKTVSYLRIRLSLDLAQTDRFKPVPGSLRVDVLRGGGNASHIVLPLQMA